MNDFCKKILPPLLFIIVTCLFFLNLQAIQQPLFFYREQQQIFLFDYDYLIGLLRPIGGLATFISQFLVQFFRISLVGSIVTALIGGTSAWLFWFTLRRIRNTWYLLPLAFLPVLFQFLYMMKSSYHYEGLVAMLFWSLALCMYSHIACRLKCTTRVLVGCFLSMALFYTMGSVAMLFAISCLIFDISQEYRHRWYACFIPLLLTVIVGILCVIGGKKPDYDYVFWMKDYVEYFIEIEQFYNLSWQSALLVMFLFWLSRYTDRMKTCLKVLTCMALLAVSGVSYMQVSRHNYQKNKDFYTLVQMLHYIDTEQWDNIISSVDLDFNNYLHLNCLNLALSHNGIMQTDLFKYSQSGMPSLVSKYQAHIEESFLFSQIYYHVGVISLAYNFAFGTSVGFTYGSPTMTKLLIKSHLIYGNYPAADKFISQLEKTSFYSDWASSQRKFLYNDQAVENDSELGVKRKSLSGNKDLFANIIGLFDNLSIILEENPENKAAMDYMVATLLLSKDMNAIKTFVEKYMRTDMLPALPELLQQAVISYAEHDPEYCRKFGVTDKVLSDFSVFKKRVLELRHSRRDIASGIADFRHTFWYYLILSK